MRSKVAEEKQINPFFNAVIVVVLYSVLSRAYIFITQNMMCISHDVVLNEYAPPRPTFLPYHPRRGGTSSPVTSTLSGTMANVYE